MDFSRYNHINGIENFAITTKTQYRKMIFLIQEVITIVIGAHKKFLSIK